MGLMEELLHLEGNVPVILSIKRRGGAYCKELEHELGAHAYTVKRSVEDLKRLQVVREVDYEGKVPNVKSWLILTDLGNSVADCLLDCQRKLGAISERTNHERRKSHP